MTNNKKIIPFAPSPMLWIGLQAQDERKTLSLHPGVKCVQRFVLRKTSEHDYLCNGPNALYVS